MNRLMRHQSRSIRPMSHQSDQALEDEDRRLPNNNLILPEEDRHDFFRLKNLFTIQDLLEARVHFGHKETMLNPHMRPFIFGKRLGVLILDLDTTAKYLLKALHVAAEMAYRSGLILFIHHSRQTGYMVEEAAKQCGEYAFCRRWNHKTLTDSQQEFGSVVRLPDLVVMFTAVDIADSTHHAVTTCAKMLIPTIGICDTNANPTLVTYPVPGNDDTPESIELYCRLFKIAILNGKAKKNEIVQKYGEEFYYKTLEVAS